MSRVTNLAPQSLDLLIIGAGIYGATLAAATAEAGYRVALIDKGDLGAGASANSLKILHGGLRYLQTLDIRRMRESIVARRDGLREQPEVTRSAPFLVPTGAGFKRSATAYRVAGWLNDLISFDRNQGVPASHAIPPVQVWNRQQLAAQCPVLGARFSGAMQWNDGLVDDTDQFLMTYIERAQAAGAIVQSHLRATGLLRSGERIVGARIRDEHNGEEGEVRAALTLHTAGTWVRELWPEAAFPPAAGAWVKAYNLIVRRNWFGDFGVGLEGMVNDPAYDAPMKRNFFFAPWRGRTMIGTVYTPVVPSDEAIQLSGAEIEAFVRDINQIFPEAQLSLADVEDTHVGILPARRNRQGAVLPEPSGTTRIYNRLAHGYLAIQGVKYTTASVWADRILALIRATGLRCAKGRPDD
jgi:glycerol-3-phosphate dehydrogenase